MATPKKNEAALAELTLALRLLVRRIRAMAPSETRECTWTQKAVLVRLDEHGPATTAELARAESVKPQSMGAVVDALEAAGLIERKAHPTDGRRINVALTPKGAAIRKSVADAKRAWLTQAVARLGKREKAALFAAGPVIKRLAEM
jgi:DNA-binding MarR family transcriptional regulator